MRQMLGERPRRPWLERWGGWLALVVVVVILERTWKGAGLAPGELWDNRDNMVEVVGDFFPPDFTEWREYLKETWVTIQMAIWAVLILFVVAVSLIDMVSERLWHAVL